jgi:hypothetical protein
MKLGEEEEDELSYRQLGPHWQRLLRQYLYFCTSKTSQYLYFCTSKVSKVSTSQLGFRCCSIKKNEKRKKTRLQK